jgi:hypothetical protein
LTLLNNKKTEAWVDCSTQVYNGCTMCDPSESQHTTTSDHCLIRGGLLYHIS